MAGDVADDEHPAGGRLESIVEVAADFVELTYRTVRVRYEPSGDVGQVGGEQSLLQRAGDLAALGVQPRVLDGDAGTSAEFLGESRWCSRKGRFDSALTKDRAPSGVPWESLQGDDHARMKAEVRV